AFALGDDEGCTAHAFHATGQEQLTFAGLHRAGRVENGSQTRAAQAVDGDTGDFLGQAGQQAGVAGDVAGVFTGLVGVAHDDVFVVLAVEGVAGDHGADHLGQQVVRTHRGQGTSVAAEGRAQTIIDISSHRVTPGNRGWSTAGRAGRGGAARGWDGSEAR